MANAMDRMQRHCHNSFKRHTALKRSMTTANKRPPEDSRNASAEGEITEWFEVFRKNILYFFDISIIVLTFNY